jgi:outer membrane receptor protein involved in Fe transport
MRIKFLLVTLFFCTLALAQSKGTITGVLTDKDANNATLPFANAAIKGTTVGTTTDENGKYTFSIAEGKYTLVFSFLGYENVEVPITVKAGETITVNKALGSGSYKLEDVVVKASAGREKESALLLDQKKAVEIKQSIGAQEMARKGVSDVEEGLTKITGITKVGDRGLFVRGLEDRYNNLLINDLAVPSNNPFKKIISLDLFPTDLVSVIETYKTFNSNLYGDFAGGTFDIILSKGEKSQTKFSLGTGFTTNNNLEKFLISEDGNSTGDFFGFSGNERNLPTVLAGSSPSNKEFTQEESINQFGSGYNVEETSSPLNTSFGISHSEKFDIGKKQNSLKYLLSYNYENKYQIREGLDRFFNTGQGNYDNNLVTKQFKFSTNTSLLGVLNYKTERLNLTSSTFFLKTTENMIQDQLGSTNGTTINNSAFIRMNQLQETTYLNTQLFGNYKLTSNERHVLKSGVSYTNTKYELPDRKSFKGVKINENETSLSYTGNSLFRQYLDFDGSLHLSGMLEYDWRFGNEDLQKAHKLKVGYSGYLNKMQSSFRFLISDIRSGSSNQVTFATDYPDETLQSEILNNNFFYKEGTNSTYKAKLQEFVNGGYFDLAFRLSESLDLNFGARIEQTSRETKYKESGSFQNPFLTKKVNKTDLLPSLNTKYKLNENSNLRFAGSKTITRPVIMEAYPLEFVNPDGTIELGNQNVKNSDNYNFDLKYEVFPTNKELIVATAFSKLINNPIERIFVPSAGSGGQIITYDNSKKALLYGVELEFLLQLNRLSAALSDFSFGFNTSLMYTKVNINTVNSSETIANDKNPSRQLQGASPWIINADLKYEFDFSENWKNTMTLVYNVYGKRIYAVGTNGLDNYYELPFSKLDFVWGNKISKNWDVKFSADNILNPLYKIELGSENKVNITETDLTIKDYRRGVGFSVNLSYSF